MTTKKLILSLTALALSLLLVIGATLAFFTDTSTESIVAAAGTVRIGSSATETTDISIFNPGDVIPTADSFKYEGNKSAVMRMRIEIAITGATDAFGNSLPTTEEDIEDYIASAITLYSMENDAITQSGSNKVSLDYSLTTEEKTAAGFDDDDLVIATQWTYSLMSGLNTLPVYEHEGTVNDDSILPLAKYIKFNNSAGNEFQGQHFRFRVVLEAAQFRNNGTAFSIPSISVLNAIPPEAFPGDPNITMEDRLNYYWQQKAGEYSALTNNQKQQYFLDVHEAA